MASVRDFRTRIRSVKSTQQITRAMKLVSAAKLRRAQERIVSARPYARKMLEVLSSLAARANPDRHPLLARRPEERVVVVVMTADRGLCGSFNTNILNRGRALLDDLRGREVRVDVIGRKARDWFRHRDYPLRRVLVDVFRGVRLEHARDIAKNLTDAFCGREIDAVHLVYNEFKSAIQQRVVVEPLLPIPRAVFGAGAFAGEPGSPGADTTGLDYLYEPGDAQLFETLLPKHVEIQVYRALLESSAAEQGARMSAMDNATRNAEEMIASLTLQMNKSRQASITKEILEVVSGAEALK
ncbi:MAG TPA: ATP synthase F1 subunit gamma [Candidatus Polarisedimenticolia bacterium]|nr:ATP synthase F1 subunit gamma [Candidatus Polarisedimenticolia bacterium]